ncbi:unnamed protein product [Albugo candida]|uniref:Uncharacterized protein n=1 Tax=Albugo candida TaxID=65357 RepID=A0A024GBP8_9STRA|nr:unnamed protein product [Albugo candida]|eukprot:CCI43762.1 unnamed protein product [Albugo candida]
MEVFLQEFEHIAPIIISSVSFVACFVMFTTWRNFSAPNYISRQIVTSLGGSGCCTAAAFLM